MTLKQSMQKSYEVKVQLGMVSKYPNFNVLILESLQWAFISYLYWLEHALRNILDFEWSLSREFVTIIMLRIVNEICIEP